MNTIYTKSLYLRDFFLGNCKIYNTRKYKYPKCHSERCHERWSEESRVELHPSNEEFSTRSFDYATSGYAQDDISFCFVFPLIRGKYPKDKGGWCSLRDCCVVLIEDFLAMTSSHKKPPFFYRVIPAEAGISCKLQKAILMSFRAKRRISNLRSRSRE
jgi:hypothetical protein